jgi:hypothetical protein
MSTEAVDQLRLDAYLREYEKLKDEQTSRVAIRDSLIGLNLLAYGSVFAFALEGKLADIPDSSWLVLLVLPWVSAIVGWTYLVSDEKISEIGRYLKRLKAKIDQMLNAASNDGLLGWENYHQELSSRPLRKKFQLLIDLFVFPGSGFFALTVYWTFAFNRLIESNLPHIVLAVISIVEIIILVLLTFMFCRYALPELGSHNKDSSNEVK